MPFKFTVLFNSVREGRWGLRAATYIAQQLKKKQYQVFLFDSKEYNFPVISHNENPDDAPQYLKDVRKEILSSDAFIAVAAEYNRSKLPALVNALDYCHYPDGYRDKSCGIFGGVRAGAQLRKLFGGRGITTPNFMVPTPTILESFSEDGQPQDEHMIKNTEELINDVAWFVAALNEEDTPAP